MPKYRLIDDSPEAVRWRRENKKRLRPYVCKLDRRPLFIRWMPWLVAWFGLALVAAGTL